MVQNKRFKVIACHPETGGCELHCSFCYKSKEPYNTKPREFWYNLIPYFAKLTDQIALGSNGEPFSDSAFISRCASLCKMNGLIANVTTNGRKIMLMNDELLKQTLEDFTMVSISFDHEKVKTKKDLENYVKLVHRIKKLTRCQVGCNLLINQNMFDYKGVPFYKIVSYLFKVAKVDRIFSLYPKSSYFVDIIPYKLIYEALTIKYPHFYTDDLTKCILERGYKDWTSPCHFGKDIISIDEYGNICGCSFDSPEKSLLKLDKPSDLLKLQDMKIEPRYSCPYLKCVTMD